MNSDRYLIDTNIFILMFNNRLSENIPQGEIACSIITEMELLSFPALTSAEETMIRNRLACITVYGINQAVKEETILLRRGHRLKLPDAIIAATAVVHNAVLVSNDRVLQSAPGLRCRQLATRIYFG
jgi:predicted nucleic acid-binding protein